MKVKVISNEYGSVLVEWLDSDGILQRGYIPSEIVNVDEIPDGALSLAVPYGVDWAFVLTGAINSVTPEVIAKMLRNRGIWTLQDARRNPEVVVGALQQAYSLDFQTILRVAEASK